MITDHPAHENGPDGSRDYDHAAEDAVVTAAFAEPTPENQHAAELAVALLQHRYDHLLRRLDGDDGTPPQYPIHRYTVDLTPRECLEAVLHGLAGTPRGLGRDFGARSRGCPRADQAAG